MISKHWSIIFRIWPDDPVYHAIVVGEFKTACGRRLGFDRVWLPMKHVKKFAKPCKSCFAEDYARNIHFGLPGGD